MDDLIIPIGAVALGLLAAVGITVADRIRTRNAPEPPPQANHAVRVMREAQLEAMIESVGRDRVFARARSSGWTTDMPPPMWVWVGICAEIAAKDAQQAKEE